MKRFYTLLAMIGQGDFAPGHKIWRRLLLPLGKKIWYRTKMYKKQGVGCDGRFFGAL
jgi:hypothetical protein